MREAREFNVISLNPEVEKKLIRYLLLKQKTHH